MTKGCYNYKECFLESQVLDYARTKVHYSCFVDRCLQYGVTEESQDKIIEHIKERHDVIHKQYTLSDPSAKASRKEPSKYKGTSRTNEMAQKARHQL